MSATSPSPGKGALVRIGDWFFRYRNGAFPLGMLVLVVLFPPAPLASEQLPDLWRPGLGIVLALLGEAFRVWVIGLAYIKRGGMDKKVYAEDLVVSGMFGVCRNPLYVGNALMLFGLLIIHGNPWVIGLGVLYYGFAYTAIVAAEEHFLRAKFGAQYDAYCERVNRFLPAFRHYRESTRGMRFDWRRALAKDYSTTYTWVVGAALLYTWARVHSGLAEASWRGLLPTLVFVVVATALTVGIRVMKKRGLLG